jgi:hypothetical protein
VCSEDAMSVIQGPFEAPDYVVSLQDETIDQKTDNKCENQYQSSSCIIAG